MAQITRRTEVDSGVNVYYDKQLLVRAMPSQIHSIAAQKKRLPQKNSSHVKYRRYANLTTAKVPLSDGIRKNGQKLSKTDINVEVKQYGDYVVITDQIDYVVEDPVLNETSQLLSQQMGETLDELTRDVLASTASVYNCQHGAGGGAPSILTSDDIKEVVRLLSRASGKMFTPQIDASQKIGTVPVRAAYWVMAHTDLQIPLDGLPNFSHVAQYAHNSSVLESEFGAIGNTRWLLSPLGSISPNASSTGTDVYNCFAAAQNSYGCIEMTDGMVQSIFKDFGESGTDRLNQQASLGWKTWYASVILNDAWLINIRCKIN